MCTSVLNTYAKWYKQLYKMAIADNIYNKQNKQFHKICNIFLFFCMKAILSFIYFKYNNLKNSLMILNKIIANIFLQKIFIKNCK